MIRRVTGIRSVSGIGLVHSMKPFISTSRYYRVKKDNISKQSSTTLISTKLAKDALSEDVTDSSTTFGKKSTSSFFSGVKESEAEFASTSSSLTPMK